MWNDLMLDFNLVFATPYLNGEDKCLTSVSK